MAYITIEYYLSQYGGAEIPLDASMRYANRASDLIDALTHYRITAAGLERFPAFVQNLVKKAVCAQVEYYNQFGMENVSEASLPNSFTVGKVSVNNGSSSNGSADKNELSKTISKQAYMYLEQTGLLYSGVPVRWW